MDVSLVCVSMMLQVCSKSLIWVLHACFKGFSWVFYSCLNGVSKVLFAQELSQLTEHKERLCIVKGDLKLFPKNVR